MTSPPKSIGTARGWRDRLGLRQADAGGDARRQEALVALSQLALEGADCRELMNHAVALVARILDVPYGAVLAWEPDERGLKVAAGVGWRSGIAEHLVIDTGGCRGAAAAWREVEPVLFEERATDPRMAEVDLLRAHEIVSGLSVLVAPRDRPYGVLAAYAAKRRPFEPGEVEFMRTAARILAIALGREYGERALFEEMQTSTVLAHVGREIMSCTEVPVLLDRICALTANALHCDHSVTWLHRPEDDGFRPAAATGLAENMWETLGAIVLPHAAAAPLLVELAERETVRVEAASERQPLLGALLTRTGMQSALFAALRQGEEVVGLQMSGHRGRHDDFTLHDQRVANGIAQLGSLALMNARVVEELERASQLKTEFVSTMSHELRTPLNIIIGYTDMLHDAATPEEQAPLLAHVRKASQELLEMIDGTLNLNRLAAGGDVARFGSVVVADLWRDLQDDFDVLTHRSHAALRWQPCGSVQLETDRRKLKIVLKNLVGNALKFTPDGEIVVSARAVGDSCEFVVRDTGVGIPAEALPYVFDMFRQADSSETRSYNGAGLGLYIVKSLLAQLGGRVSLESKQGTGSTFTVTLPIEQPRAQAAPDVVVGAPAGLTGDAHAESPPDGRTSIGPATAAGKSARPTCPHPVKPRLLFADDLPLNRFLIRRFFEREFAEVDVVEACDGEQAVTLFGTHRPDLVVLDLHMPQLDGWQAARAIRQLEGGRETPLLALSVDASPLAEANAMRAGFQEFIAKPISDYSAVKARLEHWLALRATQRDRWPKRECDSCRLEAGQAA